VDLDQQEIRLIQRVISLLDSHIFMSNTVKAENIMQLLRPYLKRKRKEYIITYEGVLDHDRG
jgi:hypothetical protein